ncbi:MAG: hypothetical protein Q8922_06535 [Bacteroidota bacterium]|nr:hypothetical protein [Bacteroidota bacterium]MDP4232748.1 hypothetical protein [Bacteroidota bacterium]MDP4244064.1 hypothetical protein [Bacteroidota bacterium]MDP4287576.1 hypothetical protein [Bacteroidota bacterium]
MVLTILDAEVDESKWALLKQTYEREVTGLPPSIHQSFLIQSKQEPRLWRVVTHWQSQADLDEMRATTEVPVAVRIFRAAQAEPVFSSWDVAVHAKQ